MIKNIFSKIYNLIPKINKFKIFELLCWFSFIFVINFLVLLLLDTESIKDSDTTEYIILCCVFLALSTIILYFINRYLSKLFFYLLPKNSVILNKLKNIFSRIFSFIKKCYFFHIYIFIMIPTHLIPISLLIVDIMFNIDDPAANSEGFEYPILIVYSYFNAVITSGLTIIFALFNIIFKHRIFITSKFFLENEYYNKYYRMSWFLILLPWILYLIFFLE